jgi:hypothetical protein
MAKRKARKGKKVTLVRKTVMVDADHLKIARQALELKSDADVLRFALEHLVSHFEGHAHEEE